MISLPGGLTVVVDIDRRVDYAAIERAVNDQGWTESYLINRSVVADQTRVAISLHVPTSAITEAGIPRLDAIRTLRSLVEILEAVEQDDQLL